MQSNQNKLWTSPIWKWLGNASTVSTKQSAGIFPRLSNWDEDLPNWQKHIINQIHILKAAKLLRRKIDGETDTIDGLMGYPLDSIIQCLEYLALRATYAEVDPKLEDLRWTTVIKLQESGVFSALGAIVGFDISEIVLRLYKGQVSSL